MIEVTVRSQRRTPYNTLPITLSYISIDRKLYRDIFCVECGKPFMAISDKIVSIMDSAVPIEHLRGDSKLIETRCKGHYCKQHYNIYV